MNHAKTRANKTDAGNDSKAICRVSNVHPSPSPDPRRSANCAALHPNEGPRYAPAMKMLIAIIFICCAFTACSSVPTAPLNQAGAIAIARQEIARRERWPEGLHIRPNITQSVCYQTAQSPEGSWTITAHKCISEDDSGNTGIEPGTKRVMVISDTGRMIRYSRAQN